MQFDSNFVMKPTRELIRERKLQERGPVQRFIDQEVIRLMDPYTPMLSGELVKSATLGTRIGTGEIQQIAPYARYQYYGMLMVSSITGSSYAIYGEDKVLTNTDLQYNTSKHPQAGPYWFERMKADKKEQILRGAQKVAGGR
jgi:hypothetical protein